MQSHILESDKNLAYNVRGIYSEVQTKIGRVYYAKPDKCIYITVFSGS